jgi:hypothetical protein
MAFRAKILTSRRKPQIPAVLSTTITHSQPTFQGISALFSPDAWGGGCSPHRETTPRGSGPYCLADVSPSDCCSDLLVRLGGRLIDPADPFRTSTSGLDVRFAHMNEAIDYARLLRWRLLTARERPVDPHGTTTQEQPADLSIRLDMNALEAHHLYDFNPWYPLSHLALADFEEGAICGYSLGHCPTITIAK